ncbi:MAG: hypothetical protein OER88_11290 [Planctomycetota bacterium]|nr:hypothetical protein [Planctomycetota bacterium]
MRVAIGLWFLTSLAVGQDQDEVEFGKKPYVIKSIECQVLIPNGWQAVQNHVGMVAQVARRPKGMGMRITRQPMHLDPKTFVGAWTAELDAGGITAKVAKRRVGKYAAWSATWTGGKAGGRTIEVWRVHAPENEMLYNIAFSLPKDTPGKDLFKGIARSFKCTAPKAELEFQRTVVSIGARTSMALPEGFNKGGGRIRGMSLYNDTYVRHATGVKPPREVAKISVRDLPRLPVQLPDGTLARSGDDLAPAYWAEEAKQLTDVSRGKPRGARFGPYKGGSISASGRAKDGTPKQVFIFAGKLKQRVVVVAIVADARLARMHKNYFKQICSTLKATE